MPSRVGRTLRAAAGVILTAGLLSTGCGSGSGDTAVGGPATRDHLDVGEVLTEYQSLYSPDGSTRLTVGPANLQLYFNGQVIWSSPQVKSLLSAYFTPDMDFYVEGRDPGVSYRIDTSERARRAGASVRLRVLDGGKAQIVSTNSSRTVLWENGQLSQRRNLIPGETLTIGESLVSPDGTTRITHEFVERAVSRLVIYIGDRAIWSSRDVFAGRAELTTDGDFRLQGDPSFPHWSTETSAVVQRYFPGKLEVIANDGKVQFLAHKPHYTILWENGQRRVW